LQTEFKGGKLMTKKKLRVVHFPHITITEDGNKAFIIEVKDLEQAKFVADLLADYDNFEYTNRIKPDYTNATFVEQFNEETGEWEAWYDEETGIDDIDLYFEERMM